jgi:hypothetical protein
MRYLVHLVCQSMSHLLQGEVERATQKQAFDTLSSKVDQLMALSAYHKPEPPSAPQLAKKHMSTPITPVLHTADRASTPQTDRTVDLYASSSTSPATPYTDSVLRTSNDMFSTPVVSYNSKHAAPSTPTSTSSPTYSKSQLSTPVVEHNTSASSGTTKVRFRLDSSDGVDEDSHTVITHDSSTEERLQLGGTATSDWLFSATSSMVKTDPMGQTQRLSADDTTDVTAEVMQFQYEHQHVTPPRPPNSTHPGSARVRELQRQLALTRQQPNKNNRRPEGREVGQQQQAGGSVSRPPVSAQLQQAAVKIPTVKYTAADRDLNRDDGDNDIFNAQIDTDGYEGMSFSSIPSQYLPTPEKEPSHPYVLDTTSSYTHNQAQSFQMNYQTKSVYDARTGAFSAH